MKKEQFWRIINEINEEVGTGDQKTILNKCSEKLSKLSAEEIASWKNIQTQYVELADRYDLQQACAKNHIYLSDDSFYYFRVWLLSQGEETFKAVLRGPGLLSRFVEDPNEARFEIFSYVSHDVYLKKAYTEEHGEEGFKKLEEEWRAKNPDEKEFDPYWLLYNMYDIYDACKAQVVRPVRPHSGAFALGQRDVLCPPP